MTTTYNSRECCEKSFNEYDRDHKGYIDQKDLPALLRKCCDEKGK